VSASSGSDASVYASEELMQMPAVEATYTIQEIRRRKILMNRAVAM
jgi:hypothetical protein